MEAFGDLIKITNKANRLGKSEVVRESNSLTFIKIQSVNYKDLPKFLEDLKTFVTKLDDEIVNLYRNGNGG